MDYPTVPTVVELSLEAADEMAARRRAAGISDEEADQERRKTLHPDCKSLKEIFLSGVDVTAYGVPVAHWTRGTRR